MIEHDIFATVLTKRDQANEAVRVEVEAADVEEDAEDEKTVQGSEARSEELLWIEMVS